MAGASLWCRNLVALHGPFRMWLIEGDDTSVEFGAVVNQFDRKVADSEN